MENLRKVQQNFGRSAADYRSSSSHRSPAALDRMIELIQPNKEDVALDVATGAGHTALKLAEYTERVIAIDVTKEMLFETRSASLENDIGNIDILLEDVHYLSFKENTFDIVTSRIAPHHFAEIKTALRQMCHVLKPGGKLYITDCSSCNDEETGKLINDIERLRDSSHVYSYSERMWREFFRELPLAIEHLSVRKGQYQLQQWFDRMNTPLENRQEIFRILHGFSEESKALYPFGDDYLTAYYIEILANKR